MIKIDRKTSTIPFGYKLSLDRKILLPINKELRELDNVKNEVLKGNISLRKASIILYNKTGRKISHVGLRKILDKYYIKSKKIIDSRKKEIFFENKIKRSVEKEIIKKQKKILKEKKKEENRLKQREKLKLYRVENKDKIKQTNKKWVENNLEQLKKYRSNYYQKNKKKIKEYYDKYTLNNATKRKKYYLRTDNDIKKKDSLW